MKLSRRDFLIRTAAAGVAMAAGSATYGYAVESEWVEVTRRTLAIPGWPRAFDGLRVAHITDLHHSPIVPLQYLESCCSRINAERPDLVALTGDYVTRGKPEEFIPPVAAALGKLRAPLGVFASLGNHDLWVDGPAMQRALERHGCTVLRNRWAEVALPGGRLSVVGLGDLWTEGVNLPSAFQGISEARASLILMHNPDTFEEWPAGHRGLILAGHTHGGQVAIPGFGPPFVPSRYGQKYARGLFRKPEATMYVNRGLGCIQLQVRLFARPEIAFLTIHPA